MYYLAFLAQVSKRDQHVIFASYLTACKKEPSKCFTVSNLFDLVMYFLSTNSLLTEHVDYSLVILALLGDNFQKGDSLLSSYCGSVSGVRYWEFVSWAEILPSKPQPIYSCNTASSQVICMD